MKEDKAKEGKGDSKGGHRRQGRRAKEQKRMALIIKDGNEIRPKQQATANETTLD